MSEKKSVRKSLKNFVGRLRSDPQLLRGGTLAPGESASGNSGPSNDAASTTSIINPTLSLDTPSDNQALREVSPTDPLTTAAQSSLPQSRLGLFPLTTALSEEELRQGGIDIVAIHGITGDFERTWTHPEGALWLKDFLPDDLSVPTRIFSFGYDAQVKFSVSKGKLDDFARSLLQALNRVRRRKVCLLNITLVFEKDRSIEWRDLLIMNQDLQSRALVFICHSMGGLVIKQVRLCREFDAKE
jgi:hypothetical protein